MRLAPGPPRVPKARKAPETSKATPELPGVPGELKARGEPGAPRVSRTCKRPAVPGNLDAPEGSDGSAASVGHMVPERPRTTARASSSSRKAVASGDSKGISPEAGGPVTDRPPSDAHHPSADTSPPPLPITRERVLREIARLAFSDPRRLFDEEGNLKPVHELDDDTAAAVESIDVSVLPRSSGGHQTRKVKLWDKKSALAKLGEHLGLFKESAAVSGELSIQWQQE